MKKTFLAAAVFCCTFVSLSALTGIDLKTDQKSVCSIGTTNYASIQDAVNAVKNNDTIKILSDVKLTSTIKVAQSTPAFTFDINGHVLDGSNIPSAHAEGEIANIIESLGDMTIIDSNPESVHTDSLASIKGGIFTGGKGGYNIKEIKEGAPVYSKNILGGAVYSWGNLTIKGCTFFRNESDYGGAVFVREHLSTFSDCNFVSNSTKIYGGAVAVQQSCTTVSNSTFTNNNSDLVGGGLSSTDCRLTVTDCKFYGNKANKAYAGGIYIYYNEASVTNCVFEENSAMYGGGCMFDSCTVVVKDCKATDNYVTEGGGAGFSHGGVVNLYHCNFSNNTASFEAGAFGSFNSNMTCVNCEMKGNKATYLGGALCLLGESVIDSCTITGNSTEGVVAGGGVIAEELEKLSLKGRIIIKDNYTKGKAANLCFTKKSIKENLATIDGLTEDSEIGVSTTMSRANGSYLFTTNGTAKDAQYFTSDDSLYSVSYNEAGYLELVPATDVPTICSIGNKKFITILEAINSLCKNDTIKILDDLKLTSTIEFPESVPAFTLDINGHVLDGSNIPMATKSGETANIIGNYTDLTIIDSNPESVHTDSLASIKGGIFTGGKGGYNLLRVENGKKYYLTSNHGGAIYSNGKLTIKGGTFFRNTGNSGGAIVCLYIPLSISDCKFLENKAASAAGAIYSKQCETTISNCMFEKNSATSGGGIYSLSDQTTINNCSFLQNTVSKSGGGIYASKSNVTTTASTFEGNVAQKSYGGGMRVIHGSSNMTGCTFSNNSAVKGGGCRLDTCQVEMNDCHFDGNEASKYCGGCYFVSATANVYDSEFTNNSCEYTGGAWVVNSSSVTAKGCKFNGNSSDTQGGGIANFSDLTLEDCSITENKSASTHKSGGLYVWTTSKNNAALKLKGKIIIKDNTTNGVAANLCLSGDESCCKTVLSQLSTDSEIGVSTMADDEDGAYQFTPDGTTDYSRCIKSDNSEYMVRYNTAGYLELTNVPTAINSVINTDNDSSDLYDIHGRKLNEVQKGINIKSGMKVLVR